MAQKFIVLEYDDADTGQTGPLTAMIADGAVNHGYGIAYDAGWGDAYAAQGVVDIYGTWIGYFGMVDADGIFASGAGMLDGQGAWHWKGMLDYSLNHYEYGILEWGSFQQHNGGIIEEATGYAYPNGILDETQIYWGLGSTESPPYLAGLAAAPPSDILGTGLL